MKLERPNPDGPENVPLREYIKSLPVAVFIYDLKNGDNIIDCREIDFSNKDDKAWLSRVSVWAFGKGYAIEMMTKKDAEGRNE